MAEPYVFVSHASADKPKIREIVDALLAADLTVWLDKPAQVYKGDEGARQLQRLNQGVQLKRLHAGESWDEQIIAFAKNAACVLVCLSEHATNITLLEKGAIWGQEIAIARANKTLVPCMVGPFDFGVVNDAFGLNQAVDLTPGLPTGIRDQHLRQLVDDVRLKVAKTMGWATNIGDVNEDRTRLSRRITYGVGRVAQQSRFSAILRETAALASVRPLLFAGPDNEQPGGFWERLCDLAPEIISGNWQVITLRWPSRVAPAEFGSRYREALAAEMRVRADDALIARGLVQHRRPVAVFQRIKVEEWDRFGGDRLNAWLGYWRSIEARHSGAKVVPIIELVMPEAPPGWQRKKIQLDEGAIECPPDRFMDFSREVKNRDILKAVMHLTRQAAANGEAQAVSVLPVLPPVEQSDGDYWADSLNGQSLAVRERARQAVARVYAPGRARALGVNQKQFSDELTPVLATSV